MDKVAIKAPAGEITPDEIKRERAVLGLSQRQLAEIFGVNENTIYRQEAGLSQVPAAGMMRLAFRALRLGTAGQDRGELQTTQREVGEMIKDLHERIKRGRPADL